MSASLHPGSFLESSLLPWQGYITNVVRNVVFSIECFFITSIVFFWSMKTGLRESMAIFVQLFKRLWASISTVAILSVDLQEFHHSKDAAGVLQIQTLASLKSLSLRQRGTSEILQGGCRQRTYAWDYRRDTVFWVPDKSSSAPAFSCFRGRFRPGGAFPQARCQSSLS